MGLNQKLGIIAGNGRFPFLVLDAARAQGYEVVVATIKEETSPEIESRGATVHWLWYSEASPLSLRGAPFCAHRRSLIRRRRHHHHPRRASLFENRCRP